MGFFGNKRKKIVITGTVCQICGMSFTATDRLARHVAKGLIADPDVADGRQVRPMPHTIRDIIDGHRGPPVVPAANVDPFAIAGQIVKAKRGLTDSQ